MIKSKEQEIAQVWLVGLMASSVDTDRILASILQDLIPTLADIHCLVFHLPK